MPLPPGYEQHCTRRGMHSLCVAPPWDAMGRGHGSRGGHRLHVGRGGLLAYTTAVSLCWMHSSTPPPFGFQVFSLPRASPVAMASPQACISCCFLQIGLFSTASLRKLWEGAGPGLLHAQAEQMLHPSLAAVHGKWQGELHTAGKSQFIQPPLKPHHNSSEFG